MIRYPTPKTTPQTSNAEALVHAEKKGGNGGEAEKGHARRKGDDSGYNID